MTLRSSTKHAKHQHRKAGQDNLGNTRSPIRGIAGDVDPVSCLDIISRVLPSQFQNMSIVWMMRVS